MTAASTDAPAATRATTSGSTSCWGVRPVAERTTFRLRVRFGKLGRLRHLSHLEVMRALERSIRRADMPYAVTQGFSPHMKAAFGPALPVGTAGTHEYYDMWLRELVPAPGAARYVPEKAPSLSAALTIARYDVGVSPAVGLDELVRAVEDVLGEAELTVQAKGKTKVFDLASVLPEEPRVESSEAGSTVAITTRMGATGSLRPEALIGRALESAGLPQAITTVTRTDLLMETEGGFRRPLE